MFPSEVTQSQALWSPGMSSLLTISVPSSITTYKVQQGPRVLVALGLHHLEVTKLQMGAPSQSQVSRNQEAQGDSPQS